MMLPKTIGNLKLVTSYYTFVSGKLSPRDTLASLSLVRYVTQLEVTYKKCVHKQWIRSSCLQINLGVTYWEGEGGVCDRSS